MLKINVINIQIWCFNQNKTIFRTFDGKDHAIIMKQSLTFLNRNLENVIHKYMYVYNTKKGCGDLFI